MEADFQGWATKPDLRCSDGRTIAHNAFIEQDGAQVPLVWQHNHDSPTNVLGHVKLEARDGGLYAHGFFNETDAAIHAKQLLAHKDIDQLSIWANKLVERSKVVYHGLVREVSLVLSGANPGARIENVILTHADGHEAPLEDEAIIWSGQVELEIAHADAGSANADDGDGADPEGNQADDSEDALANDERTIEEIWDSMDPAQQALSAHLVTEAISEAEAEAAAAHAGSGDSGQQASNTGDQSGDTAQHDNLGSSEEEGDKTMGDKSRNVFDQNDNTTTRTRPVLSHSDVGDIMASAKKSGSLRSAMADYAEEHLEHGIDDVELLFPDAQALNGGVPEWVKRDDSWVQGFLAATTKSPFARIKTRSADITFEAARAKGYVKGNLKKEEFFRIKDRKTTPTTVYKKQALDRDDIIDITDFDVVAWMRQEMRMMLDEEIARAALVGDGRAVDDVDKIDEESIRPIAKDEDLYTTQVNVQMHDAGSSIQEFIDSVHTNRRHYRGTGNPNMYTTEIWIAQVMVLKDAVGRRIYRTLDDLAAELRVNTIIPVEVLEEYPDIIAIFVNPRDYTMGAVRGGQVTMYDQFDIDFNKEKYLIETRLCGALTKLKSAIVFNAVASGLVLATPAAPDFDKTDGTLEINDTTGVVYKNSAGATVTNAGGPYTVASAAEETIFAEPATGYFFATNQEDQWTFRSDAY